MSRLTVDLNCDMGESFGAYAIGQDEALLDLVTSANIACGLHAGDPQVMQKTVKMALLKNVAIGAHPGLPDLAGFGRREIKISPDEAYALVVYQIGALWGFIQAEGGTLHHVKPHGALYNMAAVNATLAEAIAEAVYKVNPNLILYGLAQSELIKAGDKLGLKTAHEVFADRSYRPDGTLTPRQHPQAHITNPEVAAQQVLNMVQTGKVQTTDQQEITLITDTICIHGDGPLAVTFAKRIKEVLLQAGVVLKAI
ncbi:LamB/YcsF family protein [Adhaeribacter rhizoryzae]|uniref:5-oxoprolinase subunit A n=1 Tax=Adhaeribacter rhizoryzae TaxID=2607907 RepID=A0A5M6DBL6_9BACT|nr:5-oxoprolinase subunit PxpA [Adhaeribacter rhizoryzae]KAA5543449.1 LamB/YcsF family protein [Adhaeribacter rhizoryzae]